MRSLTPSERRLLLIVGALAFLVINAFGYQWLTQKRLAAKAAQIRYKAEITRLRALEAEKPAAETNREWVNGRLPAYKDQDQFDSYLYTLVVDRARGAGVTLTKNDSKPTQTSDPYVHKSIVDIEFTDEIEPIVRLLHSLQDREAFRFISYLELTPTKADDEKLRCVAKIEQWWRADSEVALAAAAQAAATPTPDAVPDPAPAPGADAAAAPVAPVVEHPGGAAVQPPEAAPVVGAPAATPPNAQ